MQFIRGIGPVLAARFDELLGGRRVLDFLLHAPSYVKPRGMTDTIIGAPAGESITVPVLVKSVRRAAVARSGRRLPTQVICADKLGGELTIQFFGSSFLDYWLEKLPVGGWRIVSGKLDMSGSRAVMNHPDFIEKPEDAGKIPEFQAIYPSSNGLTQKIFANARDQIFAKLECNTDFLGALKKIHYPTSNEDLSPENRNIQTLAYAELLSHQMAIYLTREKRKVGEVATPIAGDGHLRGKYYASLPFRLTAAQSRTIEEAERDMACATPMFRLVQGDVGSGKTAVAVAAMLNAAECKFQSALLAPTDTLAKQHYEKIKPACDGLGLECDLLTGRDKGKIRTEKLIALRSGRTNIVIGTHALFSEDVAYKNLGLVVIDEQHRFGVAQREALRAKGHCPHVLALSATPIPRTLSMTAFGDMDISVINEKPANRKPIITTALPLNRLNALVDRVKTIGKTFWVCPLVEQSETSDMMAAVSRADALREIFGDNAVGLVHGKMPKDERDKIMEKFADEKSQMKILVSTTVIEVGIDVPSATVMVIENAERFGLSALHQLRGRVGRGAAQSFCILLHGYAVGEDGQKRLQILTETDDGFVIAEQDLMMRGAGELLGARQSGWMNYHFVDFRAHRDLFKLAQGNVRDKRYDAAMIADLMWFFGQNLTMGA